MDENMQTVSDSQEAGQLLSEHNSIQYMANNASLEVAYHLQCASFPSTGLGFKLETDYFTLRSIEQSDNEFWTSIQTASSAHEALRTIFDPDLDYWLNLRKEKNPLQPLIVQDENKELLAVMYVHDSRLHYLPISMTKDNIKYHLLSAHCMYAIILPTIIIHDAIDEKEDRLFKLVTPIDHVDFIYEGGFAGRLKSHIDRINGVEVDNTQPRMDSYSAVQAFSLSAVELARLHFNATASTDAQRYLDAHNADMTSPVVTNSVFAEANAQQTGSHLSPAANS